QSNLANLFHPHAHGRLGTTGQAGQDRIMENEGNPVGTQPHVELEPSGAGSEAGAESRQRIFQRQAAGTAMGDTAKARGHLRENLGMDSRGRAGGSPEPVLAAGLGGWS